jgi:endonuclease/exonuclease/phosphatase family metal-dependent hydrolase
MAVKVTIATFNCENLFTRYNFRGKKTGKKDSKGKLIYREFTPTELAKAVKDGFIIDKKVFKRSMEKFRKLTAAAIKGVKADIVGLQEVENLDTLKHFNTNYLKTKRFQYQYLVDGNDPRFIDVGLLSNLEFDQLRTHQFRSKGRWKIFSRDCLEAHFSVHGRTLTVFVNHLKSMMGGRSKTRKRRENQSAEIIKILKERFGNNYGNSNFVIIGDLNDYMEVGEESQSGIRILLQDDQMENVLNRLPTDQRWTHFYKSDKSYHQLDYILISKSLAQKNPTAKPHIERRGQPKRVNLSGQPKKVTTFFRGVTKTTKASDHCPVAITLKL